MPIEAGVFLGINRYDSVLTLRFTHYWRLTLLFNVSGPHLCEWLNTLMYVCIRRPLLFGESKIVLALHYIIIT
jgi:hypothetical protein